MNCKKCGTQIPEGKIACLHCIRVVQVLRDRQIWAANDKLWFSDIHDKPSATLWVQVERREGGEEIYHFATDSPIDFATISFCGLNMSMGSGEGNFSSGRQQRPIFTPDHRNCPLCYDRLMNRGGGICANVCTACGGKDGEHRAGCCLRIPEPGEELQCEKPPRRNLLSDELRSME